jgi:hypothetical protein
MNTSTFVSACWSNNYTNYTKIHVFWTWLYLILAEQLLYTRHMKSVASALFLYEQEAAYVQAYLCV